MPETSSRHDSYNHCPAQGEYTLLGNIGETYNSSIHKLCLSNGEYLVGKLHRDINEYVEIDQIMRLLQLDAINTALLGRMIELQDTTSINEHLPRIELLSLFEDGLINNPKDTVESILNVIDNQSIREALSTRLIQLHSHTTTKYILGVEKLFINLDDNGRIRLMPAYKDAGNNPESLRYTIINSDPEDMVDVLQEVITTFTSTIQNLKDVNKQITLIHRDIKPENLVWTDQNFRLLDFGLVKLLRPGKNDMDTLFGTPYYAAPEAFDTHYPDHLTMKSDFYSMMITLIDSIMTYVAVTNPKKSYPPVLKRFSISKNGEIDPMNIQLNLESLRDTDSELIENFAEILEQDLNFDAQTAFILDKIFRRNLIKSPTARPDDFAHELELLQLIISNLKKDTTVEDEYQYRFDPIEEYDTFLNQMLNRIKRAGNSGPETTTEVSPEESKTMSCLHELGKLQQNYHLRNQVEVMRAS